MDGFSKIPGFIVPTIRERLAHKSSIASVAVLPALFLAFLQLWNRGKLAYTYQDQAMDVETARAICNAKDPVAEFVACRALFGDLSGNAVVVDAIRRAYVSEVGPLIRSSKL